MINYQESEFYRLLQDFFITKDKNTFIKFLGEFYNRTEGIINKNETQDELIKDLRDMYIKFNEEGIDENIVREKVDYFLNNAGKIQDIILKITGINLELKKIRSYKVNVKDHGAIGDGVTDDTVAIKKAIEYCTLNIYSKNIKPTLYFPIGDYKITSELTITNTPIKIEMDGYLLFNSNVKHGFVLDRCKNIELDIKIKGDNMSISDFTTSKDWATNVVGLSVGVKLIGCNSIILNATFDNFYGRGIES